MVFERASESEVGRERLVGLFMQGEITIIVILGP